MNKIKHLSAGCALLLLGGCASFQAGNDFDLDRFASHIKQNITTDAEIKNWLGTPQSKGVVVNKDGEELQRWLYFYSKGTLGDMGNAYIKTLEVQFDQNGIVRSYNWSGQ